MKASNLLRGAAECAELAEILQSRINGASEQDHASGLVGDWKHARASLLHSAALLVRESNVTTGPTDTARSASKS